LPDYRRVACLLTYRTRQTWAGTGNRRRRWAVKKLADALGTSVDYLISGDKSEKAKASHKNSELIQRFKEVDSLPEDEQGVLIKIISAYVRDFKAKQAYAS
jgi:hypothetical protein